MKNSFEEEYKNYVAGSAPSYWDRIERGLAETAEEKREEDRGEGRSAEREEGAFAGRNPEEEEKRQAFARRPRGRRPWIPIGTAAAAVLVFFLAGRAYLLRSSLERQVPSPEVAADTASEESVPEKEVMEETLEDEDDALAEWAEEYALPAYGALAEEESFDLDLDAGALVGEEALWIDPFLDFDTASVTSMEQYAPAGSSEFVLTQASPLSTFAADVDTASYANVRRMIEEGLSAAEIPAGAVRLEEFVNYFSYELPDPEGEEVFGKTAAVFPCPWNPNHVLLFLGVKTEDLSLEEAPPLNLTLLLDVSGSMSEEKKLPLLQRALALLADSLREEDRISAVTYADGAEVLLDGVPGTEKKQILDCIESLRAEGATNGEGGIQKAYELAERNFAPGANNRVLLATDGDLNVGISSPEELASLIGEKRDQGIFLSVLGFGSGNLHDENLETLADAGDGVYHYLDSLWEARRVLVEEMGSSLYTAAKDVKLQAEFNPAVVNAYRLLGYEDRSLSALDFRDDAADGGEVGPGSHVAALYELILTDSPGAVSLTYGQTPDTGQTDYAALTVRYKSVPEGEIREESLSIGEEAWEEEPGEDEAFAAAAAELALVLRKDAHLGEGSLSHLLEVLKERNLTDEYRREFAFLARLLAKRE